MRGMAVDVHPGTATRVTAGQVQVVATVRGGGAPATDWLLTLDRLGGHYVLAATRPAP